MHAVFRRFVDTSVFLSLVLISAAAQAQGAEPVDCKGEEIHIEVLPFDVSIDFSVPSARLATGANLVGLVQQTSTVHVEGCRATVGYADPVLYIASELRQSHCAFQTVLAHETRHLEIYRRALSDLEARIRAAATGRPLFEAAVREVRAVEALHSELDSPAEYRTNVTACGGAILRLTQHLPLLARR